jgi:hypothetical protein
MALCLYVSMSLLLYVSAGLLVCWSMVQLVSISIERGQYLSICGCGFPHRIVLPISSIMLLAIQ